MGLADIRSVTIMTTMNRAPVTAAGTGASMGNTEGGQILRKKRTFDIAFLTGQEDSDEKCVTGGTTVSSTLSSALITSASKRLADMGGRGHGPDLVTTSPVDESTSNSNSSSIDVMTNGSLSDRESELNLSPCQPRGPGQTPSPTQVVITSSLSSGGSPPCHAMLLQHRLSEASPKTRKNNNREEIRFESKRIIDINQTSDSLKIKENLQFSSTLPTSMAAMTPAVVVGPGELVNSLPFALLPQIAKFPSVHLPSPFTAKMEKSESINIISYPGICSTAASIGKTSRHCHTAQTYSDPYNLNIQIGPGGYSYPQNLMLPHDLNRSSNYPSSSHNSSHPISTQSSQVQHSSPSQISVAAAAAASAAAAAAATLLPPSLTALTLPAQNVCAKCNIGFRMTSDLVYHMRSHHKRDCDPMKKKREDKLKCPVCHETFRERHHLTRHMTAHQDRAEEVDDKLHP